MEIEYCLKDYINGVKKFIEESKNWINIDSYKFYTCTGNVADDWEESCDNANGGLDISWAFKKKEITDLEIIEQFLKK